MPLPLLFVAIKVAIKVVKVIKVAKKAKAIAGVAKKGKKVGAIKKKTGKAKVGAKYKGPKTKAKHPVHKKGKKAREQRSKPAKRPEQKSTCKNDPVDAIHGYVYYDLVDFEYPGVIPLKWERSWNSGNGRPGALGYGTGCMYTMYLDDCGGEVIFVDETGRALYFDAPWPKKTIILRNEQLSMTTDGVLYEVFNYETRLRYVFEKSFKPDEYRLARIEDETREHKIALEYDGESRLLGIKDTAGRYFEISTNKTGQITQVRHDGLTLVKYSYDKLQNLVEVVDVNGAKSSIHYKEHLMVKRVTKNGDTFHWEYDDTEENARCLHTWGDNGLLEGRFKYHDDRTVYTNSLGDVEVFYFDRKKRLTKYVDANKAVTLYTYNVHGELESIVEPDGETTNYTYNVFGQLTEVVQANGAIQTMEYDTQSRLLKSTEANGAATTWDYDSEGRIAKMTMPNGVETKYAYNESGLVSKMIEGDGENERLTELEYDEQLNPTEIKYPNGAVDKLEYDKNGNCIKSINPLGATERMEYDQGNRLVKHTAGDGNVTLLTYGAYDDVTHLKDNEREISYTYDPLGQLVSRKEQHRVITMGYSTEGFLSHVENEAGERYVYERDAMGNVVMETGYDGVRKSYRYSAGGKLTGVKRGDSSGWADMTYDKAGQLSEIRYENGDVETYSHGKAGELLTAENKSSKLAFEYDIMGNIVKETQNGQTIESEYSAEHDERTKLKTSLGLEMDMRRNSYGQLEDIRARHKGGSVYQGNLAYNKLGQILERTIDGARDRKLKDISGYDKQGRLISQTLAINNRESRRRQYQWNHGDKLESVIDKTQKMRVEYSYDSFGIPEVETAVNPGLRVGIQRTIRHLDDSGDVYASRDKSDRAYGSGGQLITANGREYRYDDCGDLVEKKESDGKVWSYEYHPSGLLEKVTRPDSKEVSFAYDPIGRRVSKEFDGRITRFLWDGDKIVHEWVEGAGAEPPSTATTWLFDEDSFTPIAKLTNDQTYTIISNQLGTPNAMLDQTGEIVWSAELDLYGKPLFISGGESEDEKCPFRFPGQYEDEETGLYYNRFRYYDPQVGQYLQQDPIGLAGGNPTLYGYVFDSLAEVDPFGLLIKSLTFKAYKTMRGGTRTLGYIATSTGRQRISTEFHHMFISQAMQKKYNLPNWLVNNRLNVWKLNTIQHSLLDKYRFSFLRKGLKPDVGWTKKYNWLTKFGDSGNKGCK